MRDVGEQKKLFRGYKNNIWEYYGGSARRYSCLGLLDGGSKLDEVDNKAHILPFRVLERRLSVPFLIDKTKAICCYHSALISDIITK